MIFLVQFGINKDSYILQRLQNFTRTVDKTICLYIIQKN